MGNHGPTDLESPLLQRSKRIYSNNQNHGKKYIKLLIKPTPITVDKP